MGTLIIGLVVGIIAGALIARNNIKKLNKIVAEAEEAKAVIDAKIDELPKKYKKILGKD
jgi:uncharacterized membrane-anchored protein YhcB (DUF1043 family)|tara:strand:- start:957 stop:1133 length:177 start_codon:yes stop_codon:yes gene_type:complete